MEKRQVKAITSLLTKVAGLVFFAFLAISLGVIFGTLFKNWVSEEPLAPVQSPVEQLQAPKEFSVRTEVTDEALPVEYMPSDSSVKYKVRVGPFQTRESALQTATILEKQGYPVYVSSGLPCYVQVGAFANPVNADKLLNELGSKGFEASIKQE